MSQNFLDNDRVTAWLEQFDDRDQVNARLLLSLLKLVSADEFRGVIMGLLEKQIGEGGIPLALFNETERPKRKGKPHRLFKETKIGKTLRAEDKVGPALVPRQRHVGEQVGSEGILANILTQFQRLHSGDVVLSPGAQIMRERKVRRFVLVTDFIGSGDRIITFLNAAWRVKSIRSWWSRRTRAGLSFDVLAYSGTEKGIERVRSHPCQPIVHVSLVCPTIRSVLPPSKADDIETFCIRNTPKRFAREALGYGEIGALIGFAHSMPNNAPAILWKKFNRKEPLFPSRVTTGVGSPFSSATGPEAERARLGIAIGLPPASGPVQPITIETIVLAALRRGSKLPEAVSGRLGLDLFEVERALSKLRELKWIDKNNQFTERGRMLLDRIAKSSSSRPLPKSRNGYYFPQSLRVPRDV